MGDVHDDELMRLYRDGDIAAFEMLFERYRTTVYNFARMMLRDTSRAEDMLQETFMTVARVAREYDCRGLFRTWLLRIVRNRCINEIQSAAHRREVMADAGSIILDPPAREQTPDQLIETDETLAAVRRAIEELPHRQREAIVLYAFERIGYMEIASILDTPVNTVKSLIHRARAGIANVVRI